MKKNMSDKDNEFAGEKSNGVRNFDSLQTPSDWRISVSNPPVSYHLESPPSQNLWHDGGGFTDAGTSNGGDSTTFKGNVEMGWSMAQFPADSGFIERAARFSLFGSEGFREMMMINHQSLGVPSESNGLYLQGTQQIASGSNLGNAVLLKDVSEVAKVRSNGSSNLSEGSQSSGGSGHVKCGETSSSKGFKSSKKRKTTVKDTEPDQSHRVQQYGEEQEEEKKKDELSPNSNANKTNNDPLKDGFIHMRARRGQATNSHSLAERVRREKISERMKFLQDLVPGCNKVTGKAVMLDEIINYVQSLQCQIEFLSMKLSAVNPLLDTNLESLITKDALHLTTSSFPQHMSMFYPPVSYLPQTGIMQPNFSSVSSLNGGLKLQETNGDESGQHNVVYMNHGTGSAPDHEDATANTSMKP